MAHLFNFFGERKIEGATPAGTGTWVFGPSEANHAKRVLRLKIGDAIAMVDGAGTIGEGEITALTDKEMLVRETLMRCIPRSEDYVAMCVGALKPGDIDEIIPPLVELGVDAIHVFLQDSTDKSRLHARAQERWGNLSVSAMKQCKRAWLPAVEAHTSLASVVKKLQEQQLALCQLHPDGAEAFLKVSQTCRRIGVIVGGEKGFSDSEEAFLAGVGVSRVTLGAHILRAKTAAVAAAAVVAAGHST